MFDAGETGRVDRAGDNEWYRRRDGEEREPWGDQPGAAFTDQRASRASEDDGDAVVRGVGDVTYEARVCEPQQPDADIGDGRGPDVLSESDAPRSANDPVHVRPLLIGTCIPIRRLSL